MHITESLLVKVWIMLPFFGRQHHCRFHPSFSPIKSNFQEFHKMTSSDDKTMKVIENGFHHLYIESDEVRKEAISETWDWIVKRV